MTKILQFVKQDFVVVLILFSLMRVALSSLLLHAPRGASGGLATFELAVNQLR